MASNLRIKDVEKLQEMAADYLQHRYCIYKAFGGRDADWGAYEGACLMLQAFGCEWRRFYSGDDTQEQLDDHRNYSHSVIFPSKETCDRLNKDAWK